jgi:hypothetical protein
MCSADTPVREKLVSADIFGYRRRIVCDVSGRLFLESVADLHRRQVKGRGQECRPYKALSAALTIS